MVSERIDDSSQAPTIFLVADGPDHRGSGGDGPLESRIRVFHDHHHPNGAAAERLRAEVEVHRRFVGEPEFGSRRGQSSDDLSGAVLNPIQFDGAERRLVEFDRPHAVSHRQHGGYRGLPMSGVLQIITHG